MRPPGRFSSSFQRSLLTAGVGAIAGAVVTALVLRPQPDAPPPPPQLTSTTARVSSPPPPLAASSASPAAPPGSAPSGDLLTRAAAGDLDALKQIESGDERRRTLDASLALARGHAALARGDLDALSRAIANDPALAHDRATLARLHDFVEREPLPLDALAAIARLPGPESADLLHAIWRRHRSTTVGLLARDLVRGEAARAQASPSLLVAIELEELLDARPREGRCAKALALVERALADADPRAAPSLTELDASRGCGADGGADCYPCLREDDLLRRAREAARAREAPTPWILPRR
ncbi:MAG: hypothetical protein U0359_39435 [Byssovorax sp.]